MRFYIEAAFVAHKLYDTENKPFRVALVFLGADLATI